MKFLIVDDFSTMRRLIKTYLKHAGFEDTHIAVDGEEALQLLHKDKFDFVITDWNMPNMLGIELLRQIRADFYLAEIPVLMVTAEPSQDQIVEAAKEGANGFITKPFTAAELEKHIHRIVSQRGHSN